MRRIATTLLALSVALCATPAPAEQAARCGSLTHIAQALKANHGETPVWRGLTGPHLVVLFQSPGGSWTLIEAVPGGMACALGSGKAGAPLTTPEGAGADS